MCRDITWDKHVGPGGVGVHPGRSRNTAAKKKETQYAPLTKGRLPLDCPLVIEDHLEGVENADRVRANEAHERSNNLRSFLWPLISLVVIVAVLTKAT